MSIFSGCCVLLWLLLYSAAESLLGGLQTAPPVSTEKGAINTLIVSLIQNTHTQKTRSNIDLSVTKNNTDIKSPTGVISKI